jgi:hypothetical protein
MSGGKMKKTTLLIVLVSIIVFTVNLYAVGNGDVDKKATAKSSKYKISDDRKTGSGDEGSTPQGYGYGSGYGEDPSKPTDRPGNDGDPWEEHYLTTPISEPESSNDNESFNIISYIKHMILGIK